jgi:hypothetical protein
MGEIGREHGRAAGGRVVEAAQRRRCAPVAHLRDQPVEPLLDAGLERREGGASRCRHQHPPAGTHRRAVEPDDRRRGIDPGERLQIDRQRHGVAGGGGGRRRVAHGASTSSVLM